MQGPLVASLLFAAGTVAFPGDWSAIVPIAHEAEPRPVSVGESIVASDGETYLIVTTDERGTRALRADAEGRIASLESIPVADASEPTQWHQELYGVAGNGSAWLISLHSATLLLHPDGEVATVNSMPAASLLSNGKSFLAWSPGRAQIISPGVPVAVIDRNALPDELRAVSTNGSVYSVASITGDAIFINVIDEGGRTVFAKPKKFVDVPPDGTRRLRDVGIARVQANFRLVWLEHDSGGSQIAWRISSADFTPAGELFAGPGVVAEGVETLSPHGSPFGVLDVTQAGPANAIVRWSVDGDAVLQTGLGCGAAFASEGGSLASNGRTMVLASSERAPYSTLAVRSAPLACDPAALQAATPQLTSWAGAEQIDHILAAGRRDALASWREHGVRRARLVSHEGQPLRWMQLPEETNTAAVLRIDTDGASYVAAWIPADGMSIRFARIVGEGEPAARVVTLAMFGESSRGMDVEWDGASFVVLWSGNNDFWGAGAALLAMRVSRDGAILGEDSIEVLAGQQGILREDVALSRGGGAMLAAWTVSGSGNGLPCGGCGNPQGVHVLRIDPNLHPLGDAAELSGDGAALSGLFRNDGAWYLISRNWFSRHNEVSRIDDNGSVSIVDGGNGEIYGVPFGESGFAIFRHPDFRFFGDLGGGGFGWPHRLADPREMTFVRAGSHMLALFAARADRLPYNGAHRAFVTSLELPAAPRRRRPVRH